MWTDQGIICHLVAATFAIHMTLAPLLYENKFSSPEICLAGFSQDPTLYIYILPLPLAEKNYNIFILQPAALLLISMVPTCAVCMTCQAAWFDSDWMGPSVGMVVPAGVV